MTEPGKPPTPNPLPDEERHTGSGGGALAGLGLQFAGAIVLCVLAGNWIDGRYKTQPWGVLVGAAVGFAAGFYSIFRAARGDATRQNGKTGGT